MSGRRHFIRNDEETQLQIDAVALMAYVLPVDAVVHHSHNEGKRSKREAGIAKAMGQRAGFADLIILWRSTCYFIEFKSSKGRQSESQKAFEADIIATGFIHYEVARSIEDVVGILSAWGLLARKIGANASIPDLVRRYQTASDDKDGQGKGRD